MSNPDELTEPANAWAWLRHWAKGITTNPPPPEACDTALAEYDKQLRKLERAEDALAEADQRQTRTDDQIGETRDAVMAAIEEAGLAPHVCDDDDLPDMVRHALAAAKKLAQPALWTYNDHGQPETTDGAA